MREKLGRERNQGRGEKLLGKKLKNVVMKGVKKVIDEDWEG